MGDLAAPQAPLQTHLNPTELQLLPQLVAPTVALLEGGYNLLSTAKGTEAVVRWGRGGGGGTAVLRGASPGCPRHAAQT